MESNIVENFISYKLEDVFENYKLSTEEIKFKNNSNLEGTKYCYGQEGFQGKNNLISLVHASIKIELDENMPYMGENIVEYVEVQIGGSKIYHHDSNYINIFNSLHYSNEDKNKLKNIMGNQGSKIRYLPLTSMFRHKGNIIPLYRFIFHELKFIVKFKNNLQSEIKNPTLILEYVSDFKYENTDYHENMIELVEMNKEIIKFDDFQEIKLFNYLKKNVISKKNVIDQVLNNNDILNNIFSFLLKKNRFKAESYFYNSKELFWVVKPIDNNNYVDLFDNITLQIYDKVILNNEKKEYFLDFQQKHNHTNKIDYVYVYSFIENPEKEQISDNFKSNNIYLEMKFNYDKIKNQEYEFIIYNVKYNILKFISGLVGLAYSF